MQWELITSFDVGSNLGRLDLMVGGEEVQEYLKELTGSSEMPNVFVRGKVSFEAERGRDGKRADPLSGCGLV